MLAMTEKPNQWRSKKNSILERRRKQNRLRIRRYRAKKKRRERYAKSYTKLMESGARPISNYGDLVVYLKSRRIELGLSQAALDGIAGFQTGYTFKLESYPSPNHRVAGARIMPRWFEALGVKLLPMPRRVKGSPTGEILRSQQ